MLAESVKTVKPSHSALLYTRTVFLAVQPLVHGISAPTRVLAHDRYVNFDNDDDSGMDDASGFHRSGANRDILGGVGHTDSAPSGHEGKNNTRVARPIEGLRPSL
jgi:hypothetical protein